MAHFPGKLGWSPTNILLLFTLTMSNNALM